MLYISYYLFAVLRHVPLNKDLQALIICNIKFPTIMVPTKIILPKIISQNHSVLLCSISRCHPMDLCFLVAQVDDLNGKPIPARVNPRPKKIDFFVPSNITSHYTCYCSILKAIFMPAEERSATFSRHSTLFKHPSYLKNGSSVFHTISILSSCCSALCFLRAFSYYLFCHLTSPLDRSG